ncbi:15848_t:CDS:2, partial [Funneliformis mosseae]
MTLVAICDNLTRFCIFLSCTICITNFLKTEMFPIYQEIKRLTRELPEEKFTKIIAHISSNVILTNQVNDALALFDTDEKKRNYLVTFSETLGADDLKSSIKNIEEKLGDIYELSARFEISKIQGTHYASKFEVFDLNGLVKLALPRKQLPSENAYYDSQAYVLLFRVNKLANYIYNKGMRKKLGESIEYIRQLSTDKNYNKNLHELAEKADLALKQWTNYEGTAKSNEKRLYLANTPELSIMLMTAYAPFNCRLDIDLRGRTSGSDIANITVELGEIKSSNVSKAIKKGYRQLLLRLAVISYVIEACSDEKEMPKFNLSGKVYVPKTDSNLKIPSEIWNEGINFSSSVNYHDGCVTKLLYG